MKQEPSDQDEEARSRSIAEQCWLAPLCLLFWIICILALFFGCSAKGGECRLAWDAAPNVDKWRIYCGLNLLAEVSQPAATVTLPDAACTVAVVAINAAGTSPPAKLKLSFLTDQQSIDLRAWSALRSYHREFLPGRRFYRIKIETPP